MTLNLNAQFIIVDIGYRRSATYFRTPVTEALCSSLALKKEHTEGVREMQGSESDEGTQRWRKLCIENVWCPPGTVEMTTAGTGL